MLGIGDGEFPEPAVGQGRREVVQLRIRFQGRPAGDQDPDPADGIQGPLVQRPAFAGKVQHERLIGREEQFEGRALRDLAPEIAGRSETERHRFAALRRKQIRDLLQGAGGVARDFYAFIQAPPARAVFERYGFALPVD